MKKRYAIITDIHGNLEAFKAVLDDIKTKNVDEIYCLGDTINIGPNSKECIDLLMKNNIKSTIGNHELYLLRGDAVKDFIYIGEKNHYEDVKNSLNKEELDYIKSFPLYFELNVDYENGSSKKIVLTHFLINDEKLVQPFEEGKLYANSSLWEKYSDPNTMYIIGHVHHYKDVNDIPGISNDYIESTGELTNIEVVDSVGCTNDEYSSYMILDIDNNINIQRIKVKYDREKFLEELSKNKYSDRKFVMKKFYGIEI